MKTIIPVVMCCLAVLPSQALAVTATFTASAQTVTLTGLGMINGIPEARVSWGSCAFDGKNTNCTVSAPYTGVGGPGTINMVLSYAGNAAASPFTANYNNPAINQFVFGLTAGNSGSISVNLQESNGSTVSFLPGVEDNFFVQYNNPTCTGIASSSCIAEQVAATPGATITGTVTGTFDATPVISAAISASSYGGFSAVAPSTWMEIYGVNLANVTSQTWAGTDFKGNQAPTTLGSTTVTIGGLPAYIDFVSPNQVNAQVPSGLTPGPQPVVVTMPGGVSVAKTVQLNATEPGLWAPSVFDQPAGQYVGALLPNGATFILPPGLTNAVPTSRAHVGSTIIMYGVGFGAVSPSIPAGQIVTQTNNLASSVQILFAGVPGTVQFAGLVAGNVGLYQFNVVVPNVASSDTVPVTFTLGGTPGTQQLIIPIGN
jgi:uncharacterized protein (TIGR03437 family)